MLILILLLFIVSLFRPSESQFLYPVDENAPQISLTFTCFSCNSEEDEGCGEVQTAESNQESCTGVRIGCWITLDVDTGVYERSCVQPESIRQGVFCNRLMEGREFCFYEDSPTGPQKRCSMCCLSDGCHGGILQQAPDPAFQTCVKCSSRFDEECRELPETIPSRLTEQCLMPNSDCWMAKTSYEGEDTYIRGCQIQLCTDENVRETCTVTGDGTTVCSKCCRGANQCNRDVLRGSGTKRAVSMTLHLVIVTIHCCAGFLLAINV